MDEFCGSTFWDSGLTWYTNDPDFTPCFQRTALVWLPSGFLLLLAAFEIYSGFHSRAKNIPWTGLNAAKCGVTIIIVMLQLVELGHVLFRQYSDEDLYPVDQYTPLIKILTFILVLFLDYFNRLHGIRSSGVIFLFWTLLAICEAPAFRTALRNPDTHPQFQNLSSYIVEVIYFPLILAQLFLNFWADAAPLQDDNLHAVEKPCPEREASFISKILFVWFEKLARQGYKKPLEFGDLWDLNPEDSSKTLNPRFLSFWTQRQTKPKKSTAHSVSYKKDGYEHPVEMKKSPTEENPNPVNIFPIILKTFAGPLIAGAMFKLLTDVLLFVPPMLLNLLIQHVEGTEPTWKGYLYAVLLFFASFAATILSNQYFYQVMLVGMRIRTAVVGAIYRKALRISNASREESTVGEIVNLMSVDAQRLTDMCLYLNIFWSAPFEIGLALYFLWNLLGPSSLAGLSIMILLIPVNGYIGSRVRTLQMKQMKLKDQRIKIMNEILNGIKVLKLYAWEKSFEEKIMKIRAQELKVIKTSALYNACIIFIWTCAPALVSIGTFATYLLIDESHVLDAQKAFVSLTYFNLMRMPLNMISIVIVYIIQASVSVKRMNKYMNSEEIPENSVQHDNLENNAIKIQNGNFGWKADKMILNNINLNVQEGSLVAIVGTVGVGKSTLLSAILGEVEHNSGLVNTKGRIAYVSQQAWIQNATVRDNILFGLPFEHSKYEKVLDTCALKPDLEILPASDKTEIGEKGINLSGGQKQRVALARATYNNADVYLLDDPLSAVDSHVGKHLFDKVIGPEGLLKRKTRVLVTHGITFLPEVDKIIVLKDGVISETGTFNELLDKKGAFADFLIQHLATEGLVQEQGDLEAIVGSKEELRRHISQLSESDDHGLVMRKLSRQISTLSQSTEKVGSDGKLPPKRTISQLEKARDNEDKLNQKAKLTEIESMESGNVKLSIFLYYMNALGYALASAVFFFQLLFQVFSVASNLWLSDWSSQGSETNGTMDSGTRDMYLGVYGALGGGQGISILIAGMIMAVITIRASGHLHWVMLNRILKAPMSFFDTTPTGRVVNRFAKDVDVTDNAMPMTFMFWLNCFFTVIFTFGIICYSTPIFFLVVIPVSVLYFFAQRYYVASLRQLRRLESVSRSPIYSHFSETLAGTMTIRAFGMQERFIQDSDAKVDHNQSAFFPSLVANRYISIFLELVGNIVVLFAAVFAIMSRETLSPGIVGLSISYSLSMTSVLNWLVKMTSDCETNLVSVERLKEYGEVPQEADWESASGKKPVKHWPADGEIIFDGFQARYREGLDLVLRGVTCKINPGEKVGIVGRTGAGKSSLTLGLFRIIEAAGGSITIDGHDISNLGLHELRSRLTIIPQDPIIFSGTLRMNLDPFAERDDQSIWRALEQAHLKPFVKGLSNGLDYELTEGGDNLSVGQRQLVCLARALLRKTKILILDEATAAVDLETDELIQATIRKEFEDSTIVTIAHRLNTIMDYTRVMVLDKGVIREFEKPSVLLENKNSIFYGMAKDAGIV